jgi:hypothetical protein
LLVLQLLLMLQIKSKLDRFLRVILLLECFVEPKDKQLHRLEMDMMIGGNDLT